MSSLHTFPAAAGGGATGRAAAAPPDADELDLLGVEYVWSIPFSHQIRALIHAITNHLPPGKYEEKVKLPLEDFLYPDGRRVKWLEEHVSDPPENFVPLMVAEVSRILILVTCEDLSVVHEVLFKARQQIPCAALRKVTQVAMDLREMYKHRLVGTSAEKVLLWKAKFDDEEWEGPLIKLDDDTYKRLVSDKDFKPFEYDSPIMKLFMKFAHHALDAKYPLHLASFFALMPFKSCNLSFRERILIIFRWMKHQIATFEDLEKGRDRCISQLIVMQKVAFILKTKFGKPYNKYGDVILEVFEQAIPRLLGLY